MGNGLPLPGGHLMYKTPLPLIIIDEVQRAGVLLSLWRVKWVVDQSEEGTASSSPVRKHTTSLATQLKGVSESLAGGCGFWEERFESEGALQRQFLQPRLYSPRLPAPVSRNQDWRNRDERWPSDARNALSMGWI